MDTSKVYEFFAPDTSRVHIIGCGSVGSAAAENLARSGVTRITLWDFDTVSGHNIANQMYTSFDVGKQKSYVLGGKLLEINPEAGGDVKIKPDGWKDEALSGYVFLCVDSIETRRNFVEKNFSNPNIKAVFDFRTELERAQLYAANWENQNEKRALLKTMQFTHEEAKEATPVSACGVTLGVVTTARIAAAFGVNNYINFIKDGKLKTFMVVDCFAPSIESF